MKRSIACLFPTFYSWTKLQDGHKITADKVKFLSEIHENLKQSRAFEDLRTGWMEYLETEMKLGGNSNPTRSSECSRRERNKTPTVNEID